MKSLPLAKLALLWATLVSASALAQPSNYLIDIDVGIDVNDLSRVKSGFAALGLSTNDFWTRIDVPNVGSGAASNLVTADGLATSVSFTITNAPGHWGCGSPDVMYDVYAYAQVGQTATAALLNLPGGTYDVLLYGLDGNYKLRVGGTDYGTKLSHDYPVANPPVWQEGRQYVRYRNIHVSSGGAMYFTIMPGTIGGYALLSGVQLSRSDTSCVPHRATATAQLVNGFVVGASITDPGCGYTNTPLVLILGGGGSGAAATAVVSNGLVSEITVTNAGAGYASTPAIYIYSPFGLQIGLAKAVRPSFSDLPLGMVYQLQVSSDMQTWTNQGAPFTVTNASMIYPQYWDVDNWNQLFFRLQPAPPSGQ